MKSKTKTIIITAVITAIATIIAYNYYLGYAIEKGLSSINGEG